MLPHQKDDPEGIVLKRPVDLVLVLAHLQHLRHQENGWCQSLYPWWCWVLLAGSTWKAKRTRQDRTSWALVNIARPIEHDETEANEPKAVDRNRIRTFKHQKRLTVHYLSVNLAKFFNLPKVKRHIWCTTSNQDDVSKAHIFTYWFPSPTKGCFLEFMPFCKPSWSLRQ